MYRTICIILYIEQKCKNSDFGQIFATAAVFYLFPFRLAGSNGPPGGVPAVD